MPDDLRIDRDRFVAFAFCDADILLELDRGQNVVFAAGATVALTGEPPEAMVGRDLFELIVEDQHNVVREVVRTADGGARIEPMVVRLNGRDGETPPLALSGFQLPDVQGHYFLALRMGMPTPNPIPTPPQSREPASGLFDRETFTEVASNRLDTVGASDGAYKFSVFQLGGMSELRARLDEERRIQLLATIGETLRAESLYGDSAGRLDDERFGLIHEARAEVGDIRSKLETTSREADPERQGVHVRAASVDLDTEGMSDTDAYKALVYTISHLGGDDGDPDIQNLSQGLAAMVEETAQEMAEARIAVDSDSFEVLYQPIVDLDTQDYHHFEVLARFGDHKPARAPSEFFQFVEEVGLIRDLDLACCRRSIRTLRRLDDTARLSVNLSNASLRDQGFVDGLLSLLKDNGDLAPRLHFDVKESAIVGGQLLPHKVMRELRSRGHSICVDDFGAGASILHYLQAVDVDMVKIESKYLADVLALRNGGVFLQAISDLCQGLGVTAIASMVEDQSFIRTIRDCGIRYAQGYLFGKPSEDVPVRKAVAV